MIRIEQLSCTFHKETPLEVQALKPVTLNIPKGENVIIIGTNGSGKSTLLNLIAGTIKADTGKIMLEETNLTALPDYRRSKLIARVFQDPLKGTAADLSILENFRLAALRTGTRGLSIGTTASFRELVKEEVSRLQLGLENNLDRKMGTLSGGQRQALTLLMAVMSPCQLLLMDEPTSALDPRTAAMVMEIAEQLIKQHQLTTIHITHQLKDALHYGNRLIMMREGSVAKDISAAEKQQLSTGQLYDWFAAEQ
jgi:putative ABC transport system ATP-binding protein